MTEVTELNKKFGIGNQLSFKKTPDKQVIATINNEHASATLALQGGHLMTWTPTDAEPVVWLSSDATLAPGKSIRGGVPICWPWFGAHQTQADFPAHGFARTVQWQVIDTKQLPNGDTQITLQLGTDNIPQQLWPHATTAQCEITIGNTLGITLTTFNNGQDDITISEALHTYFAVSDVRNISISGLDKCQYLDKVEGMQQKQQSGDITFASEVDRVYIDTEADCVIRDPALSRQIRIGKTGSRSTVVWNPWIEKSLQMGDMGEDGYLKMVCVESANAANNQVSIAAGEQHQLAVSYQLESI